MTVTAVPGTPLVFLGPSVAAGTTVPLGVNTLIDAANEALIAIGYAVTSDGGSHTIDTTGSSSIGWRSGSVTFANAGTTFNVGIGSADTANGPPARAANVADVITLDVAASYNGAGAGVTANAWQTSVPTTGTKTIANGDLIAISWQMTARNTDLINVTQGTGLGAFHRPTLTSFTGASYATLSQIPNAIITFSDGATCHLQGTDLFSTINTRTWNSGSATKEYGQLFNFPFPYKIYGLYGYLTPSADCDVVLYSAPLSGSPVAEKTVSIDLNVTSVNSGRRFYLNFASPYSVPANTDIAAVFKPGASNVSVTYKTLNAAGHRVADVFGTSGYGISRASGAFANANSSLDHYYIGLIVGAFEHGVWPMGYLGV